GPDWVSAWRRSISPSTAWEASSKKRPPTFENSPSSPAAPIHSEAPRIPDHEVLRCIGKGSYGEVWLSRSLTGSLRAIKVVRREDSELDRTFEREFDAIRRFEPISRDHPGLAHILQVVRNAAAGIYCYVVELG